MENFLRLDEKFSAKLRLAEDQTAWRKVAAFIAHTGDSWYLEFALLIIWLFSTGDVHKYAALLAGSIIIQAVLVLAIKFLIKRKRPEGDWGAVYRNADPHSFPSGHAARMLMLSVIIFGLGCPLPGFLVLLWGLGVSFARVALGVHFLSDLLGGWIIGIALAQVILVAQPLFYNLFPFVF